MPALYPEGMRASIGSQEKSPAAKLHLPNAAFTVTQTQTDGRRQTDNTFWMAGPKQTNKQTDTQNSSTAK